MLRDEHADNKVQKVKKTASHPMHPILVASQYKRRPRAVLIAAPCSFGSIVLPDF